MVEVSFKEYMNELTAFAKEHNEKGGCKEYTTAFENDTWSKTIAWEDGAEWCETTSHVLEPVHASVHGIQTTTYVEMYRTEFWSTQSGSKYMYQPA